MQTLLLVDDHHVLYRSGTRRVLHSPTRYEGNPVVAPDTPWDGAIAWTNIIRDAKTGKYQIWYQAFAGSDAPVPQCMTCYAESDDGLNFTKPQLGVFAFGEHDKTNIVMVGNAGRSFRYSNAVVVDERDPDPAKRYKMADFDFSTHDGEEYPGLHVAFSPDGIHWTRPDIPMPRQRIAYGGLERNLPVKGEPGTQWCIPLTLSDTKDVFWDEPRGVFADYGKMWIDGPAGDMAWKHAMGRSESKDFINWSKPELVLTPDDVDPPHTEFHTSPVFYHAGCYFSLAQVLNRAELGGVIDIELMLSRDGFRWERPFRDTFFIDRENAKSFEAGSMFTNSTPVILDDEIRFYYGAYSFGATSWSDDEQVSGVGMASIPRDRFAGIRSVEVSDQVSLSKPLHNVGQVTLKPIDISGISNITLNADASDGEIRVELLDAEGYRIEGFTDADAVPITGDSLRHGVSWRSRGLDDLKTKTVMPRIHLKSAEVFAVDLLGK
jgi:hypothetical protein